MSEPLPLADDADQATLRAAITALRAKQRAAVIPSTAAEYAAAVDALLERVEW